MCSLMQEEQNRCAHSRSATGARKMSCGQPPARHVRSKDRIGDWYQVAEALTMRLSSQMDR